MPSLPRLYLNHDAEGDTLIALEFGRVHDGQPPEHWRPVGDAFAYLLESPAGRAVGFELRAASRFDPDGSRAAELWSGPRFDVPLLGLDDVPAGEVVAAARTWFGSEDSINRTFAARARESQGEERVRWWRACLETGDATAHAELGRALHELGRHAEARPHLRYATELAPYGAAHWRWRGRSAEALGDREEASHAYRRAVAVEAQGGGMTDARGRLAAPAASPTQRGPRALTLWGDRLPALGERRVEAVGEHVGIALTAGAVRKRRTPLDPNEDTVAGVVGPRATLVVCADGHNGASSSRVAVEHLLERLGDDPPPADLSDAALVEHWHAVNQAVAAAADGGRQRDSRTTLVLAFVAGTRVQWAALGDSMLAVVRAGRLVRRLDFPQPLYLGWPMTREEVAHGLRRGSVELDPGDWAVLATDGFVDFARPNARDAILRAVQGDPDAPGLAARLVDAACDGGAGDNVAVAVVRVAEPVGHRPEEDAERGSPLRERLRPGHRREPRTPARGLRPVGPQP